MRDAKKWRGKLVRRLRDHWHEDSVLDQGTVCDIELALTLHHHLTPDAPVESTWIMLAGYPFPVFHQYDWSPDQIRMLGTAISCSHSIVVRFPGNVR